MLYELLYQDRKLLDGLDKVMSIYPVEDWPYFRRRREAARQRFGDSAQPATAILPQVRQAITERGPLSSLDLDHNETVDWAWAPARLSPPPWKACICGENSSFTTRCTRAKSTISPAATSRTNCSPRRSRTPPTRHITTGMCIAGWAASASLEQGRRRLAGHAGDQEQGNARPRWSGWSGGPGHRGRRGGAGHALLLAPRTAPSWNRR